MPRLESKRAMLEMDATAQALNPPSLSPKNQFTRSFSQLHGMGSEQRQILDPLIQNRTLQAPSVSPKNLKHMPEIESSKVRVSREARLKQPKNKSSYRSRTQRDVLGADTGNDVNTKQEREALYQTFRASMTKRQQALAGGSTTQTTPFAGAKTKRDISLSKRGVKMVIADASPEVKKRNTLFDQPPTRKFKSEKQPRRYEEREGPNPYLSQEPKKNKIIEMLQASTPMRNMRTRLSRKQAAGNPVTYETKLTGEHQKRHFNDNSFKSSAIPQVMNLKGVDTQLYNEIQKKIDLKRQAQAFK